MVELDDKYQENETMTFMIASKTKVEEIKELTVETSSLKKHCMVSITPSPHKSMQRTSQSAISAINPLESKV